MALQRSRRSRVPCGLCRDAAHAGVAEGADQQEYGRDNASCEQNCHAFSPRRPTCSHPAWRAPLKVWLGWVADQRIEELSNEIEELARRDPACVRLMSVPGIGPIISSAMVAAIGTGDGFSKGRDFAAWLGLVPKQISTGDRTILGSISKRGNRYLRVLFVQAAWVTLVKVKWQGHGLKPWIEAAKKRLHHNVLAIALANKLARIAWSVLARGRGFEANKLQAA